MSKFIMIAAAALALAGFSACAHKEKPHSNMSTSSSHGSSYSK